MSSHRSTPVLRIVPLADIAMVTASPSSKPARNQNWAVSWTCVSSSLNA